MTRRGITEYIEAIRERYVNADKKRKGRMLDEAEQVTGYHRKVLVRLLGGRQRAGPCHRRGRRRRYSPEAAEALRSYGKPATASAPGAYIRSCSSWWRC